MDSLTLTAIVFAIIFAGGAIGLELQHALPESYTTGGPGILSVPSSGW